MAAGCLPSALGFGLCFGEESKGVWVYFNSPGCRNEGSFV
jgi:hypothetical protein